MGGLMQIPEFAGFIVGLAVGTLAGFVGAVSALAAMRILL